MYLEQYLLYLIVFSFIAYFIVTDQSVAALFVLGTKILKNRFERVLWMIRFHPIITTNKIFQWFMLRKYMKEAKKMEKEMINND